jgi:glycine cleavage system transcriptional repressor
MCPKLFSMSSSLCLFPPFYRYLAPRILTTHNHYYDHQTSRLFSSKTQQLIINAVGTDRLGIVSDMTKEVIEVGGNVGESQAARLGKHFSLMMLVEVPQDKVDTLQKNLSALQDLTASVCLTDSSSAKDAPIVTPAIGYRGQLTLSGADNPGIVHKVTKILSTNGLNIDKLETSDELAPQGGTVLFKMKGIAHAYEPLSAGFDVGKIKQELAALGDELNCDIDLMDVTGKEYHGSFYSA